MGTKEAHAELRKSGGEVAPWHTSLRMSLTLLAGVGLLTLAMTACKDKAATEQPAAAPTPAAAPAEVPLTPAQLKEVADRDTYATNFSKELHARVPLYKNVNIYADNYAGPASPNKVKPQPDSKTRKGDNTMLVFSSPEAGTAKGLADFTKSKAGQDASNVGFSEMQFVDPDTYCFALVSAISGPGDVKCGPR